MGPTYPLGGSLNVSEVGENPRVYVSEPFRRLIRVARHRVREPGPELGRPPLNVLLEAKALLWIIRT